MTIAEYAIYALTPQLITRLLHERPGWEDIEIADVVTTPVGTGQMAHSYRLALTYDRRTEGTPDSIIAKLPSTDPASRQMAAATGAYQREVQFYQHLGGITGVRSPNCFHAELSDNLTDFLLLLEDMGPARTVEQIGGCNVDQADLALAQAAALHGGSWLRTELREQRWLPVENVWNALAGAIPNIIVPWLDRFGTYLEPDHINAVHRLGREVTSWLAMLSEHRTLWHGDFRLDNLLFDAQGGKTPIAVVDWQSTAVAPGVIDVSYFLGNSLSETDRSNHERALVDEYHRRVTAQGVENYGREQCWREYQAHALYGLVLTIPASMGVESTERGDAMFGAMASRAAQQIVDNESFEALAALGR